MILILLISKGKFSMNKPFCEAIWKTGGMDSSGIQERVILWNFNSATFNFPNMMWLLQF